MSPKLQASKGGRVEEDRDERTGVEGSGGSCAGSRRRLDVGGSGGGGGGELSAGGSGGGRVAGGWGEGAGGWGPAAGIQTGRAGEARAGRDARQVRVVRRLHR